MKLTSDVKQNKEVNIIDPNPNDSYKTKKKFTGSYTEVNPEFLFEFSTWCVTSESCAHLWESWTGEKSPYQQVTMYYFVYYKTY